MPIRSLPAEGHTRFGVFRKSPSHQVVSDTRCLFRICLPRLSANLRDVHRPRCSRVFVGNKSAYRIHTLVPDSHDEWIGVSRRAAQMICFTSTVQFTIRTCRASLQKCPIFKRRRYSRIRLCSVRACPRDTHSLSCACVVQNNDLVPIPSATIKCASPSSHTPNFTGVLC